MRSMLAETRDASTASPVAVAAAPAAKEIPYDHVAVFPLIGVRGNRVQDVMNVSIDGTFVAVAVGYSFIPGAVTLPPLPAPTGGTSLLPTEAVAEWWLTLFQSQPTLAPTVAQCLLARTCGIDFKYSVVDSGSGRELQNRPIHNLAGLGEAGGNRPFRPLAKPMLFLPRSTIRIEVEEISEGAIYVGAQLFLVLHGYKMLGHGAQ